MKRIIIFLLICCVYFPQRVAANHLLGGEISYRFLSASGSIQTYQVTLSFFGDCASNTPDNSAFPALVNADPTVWLYKEGALVKTLDLTYNAAESNKEITPVCPDEAGNTTCSNINNPLPGIKRFVYTGEFQLNGTSSNWSFAFKGIITNSMTSQTSAGRSLIIQNAQIVNPLDNSVSIMYLEATLNNIPGTNSSATFTSLPTPFFCLNKPTTYSLGAADPENDQLVFSLIPGKEVNYNPPPEVADVTYIPPFTAQEPLPVVPGSFNFSTNTGQLNFTPNQVKNCIVTNLVEEYRDGVKVGSCMREMTFVILNNCNNDVPLSPVSGIENANVNVDANGNLLLSVCEGQTANISFDIACSDPNGDNTTVTYSNLPEGAVITVDNNGTLHPTIHFVWNVIDAAAGNYIFYVTYTDDGCPLVSRKTIAYTVTIIEHTYKFSGATIASCSPGQDGAAWVAPVDPVNIDYEYRWVDSAGNTMRQQHSTTGDSLRDIPPGKYKVYIRNADGCGKNVEFTVEAIPLPEIQLSAADTLLCTGIPVTLATDPQSGVDYSWSDGTASCCITVTTPGTYTLTATNRCGSTRDSVKIDYVKCNFCLFVPNAFTPNGDGKNDRFNILETCLINKYKLQVFNRWGQLVFTSLSVNNSWDGTYKGHEAESGTYFYVIDAVPVDPSKGTIVLKGDLTLIR